MLPQQTQLAVFTDGKPVRDLSLAAELRLLVSRVCTERGCGAEQYEAYILTPVCQQVAETATLAHIKLGFPGQKKKVKFEAPTGSLN